MWRERQRALGFGTDAVRYERVRPSYPSAMIDDLMASAPQRVLDIGCGTGKAARLFAARGCDVLGVEPDERMAAVARATGVSVEVAAFEQWDSRGRAFDLAVSGQAWHWIDPHAGLAKAAEALPGGARLAVFWNRATYDDETAVALDEVYQRHAPQIADRSVVVGSVPDERLDHDLKFLAGASSFLPPDSTTYRWRHEYTGTEFANLLRTHSDHRTLPAGDLRSLLDAVAEVVAAQGGRITVRYRTRLLTALRRDTEPATAR